MLPAGLTLHLCNLTFNKDSTQGKLRVDFPRLVCQPPSSVELCLVISSLLRLAKFYFCLLNLMRLLSPLRFHYPKCASKQKSREITEVQLVSLLSQIKVLYCYCLMCENTVSYILSSFLVVYIKRLNPFPISLLWLET